MIGSLNYMQAAFPHMKEQHEGRIINFASATGMFGIAGQVIGSLNYMQAAFPHMKEQHEGRIINFASATGMFGIAGQLAYGSNKEALRGLTKIAAKEWGQYGITVNAACSASPASSPTAPTRRPCAV